MEPSEWNLSLPACMARDWSPRIGDPEITGWLTVLVYLATMALAAAVAWRGRGTRGNGFWGGIALLMLFLALNKQLDLQSALTAFGRCLSHAQGWWEHRRLVQLVFILLLLAGMVWAMRRVVAQMNHALLRRNRLALAGLGVLCAFVLMRAVGFHFVDVLIGVRIAGIPMNFIFENIGLILIAINAFGLLRRAAR